MYHISIPPSIEKTLVEANQKSPSIASRLVEMLETPLIRAVRTNLPLLGNYYINAGRWCILFNINEEDKIVELTGVKLSSGLYNIMRSFKIPE